MFSRNFRALISFGFIALSLPAFGSADYVKFKSKKGQGSYTIFETNSKTNISMGVDANGTTGFYCINGSNSCGRLFDIEFDQDGSDMRGKWIINGRKGTFVWNFDSEKSFSGGFRFNQNMKPSEEADSIYVPFDGDWVGTFN